MLMMICNYLSFKRIRNRNQMVLLYIENVEFHKINLKQLQDENKL